MFLGHTASFTDSRINPGMDYSADGEGSRKG
jgi:hypothetical protein